MEILALVENCTGFEWDHGNSEKNVNKHNVLFSECEEVFFNQPILFFYDLKHSQNEPRYFLLGQTDSHRKLFLVFTIRNHLIRVISARDMSKKEKNHYDYEKEKHS